MRSASGALVVAALLVGLPSPASAFDDEVQLGADLYYSALLGVEEGPHGVGAGLQLRYGLTDAIGISGAVAWTGQLRSNEGGGELELDHLVSASVGAVYALDVLRLVPYLGIRVGAAVDPVALDAFFYLDLSAGFDFLWNRDVSTGLVLGYGLFVGDEVLPARFTVGVRVSWHRLL